jgi:hypothetical protein
VSSSTVSVLNTLCASGAAAGRNPSRPQPNELVFLNYRPSLKHGCAEAEICSNAVSKDPLVVRAAIGNADPVGSQVRSTAYRVGPQILASVEVPPVDCDPIRPSRIRHLRDLNYGSRTSASTGA